MSLKKLQEKIGANPDGAFGPNTLKMAMEYFKLTPEAAAHFFGQTAHETGSFRHFSENLNYSAKGLQNTFGKYFPDDLEESYARQPIKIASRVYANRIGNGDEASQDGWKYRGRGALQLTGKSNYQKFSDSLNRPEIMSNPDLVADEYAFESAMFFFTRKELWDIANLGVNDSTILTISKKINGGTNGLADRVERTKKYYGWLTKAKKEIKKTISIMYTREQIEEAVKSKGYVWFDDSNNKGFDVNIVGVRNLDSGTKVTNVFDDYLTISYKEDGEWKFYCWMATTDPGKKAMEHYHNANGVAILKPGQYRGSHKVRLHAGKYEALGQQKDVTVYRDADRDMEFDLQEDKTQTGLFGINIHRSNPKTESTYVENWSEGCQVFKKVKDFNEFMKICNKAKGIHGNSFTYTLITSKDIA